MLGRRGEFEGVADWLPVLPLWNKQMPSELYSTVTLQLSSLQLDLQKWGVESPGIC